MIYDEQIQEHIDKARNINNIKIAIEVIRNLEQFKNTNPIWCSDSETAIPTYFMYKDLHAVERILLNKYEDDLTSIYWLMYKYITNITQKALFEEKYELKELAIAVDKIIRLEGIISSSDNIIYHDIDYIKNSEVISKEFSRMVDWLYTTKYDETFKREAYNSGFLKK